MINSIFKTTFIAVLFCLVLGVSDGVAQQDSDRQRDKDETRDKKGEGKPADLKPGSKPESTSKPRQDSEPNGTIKPNINTQANKPNSRGGVEDKSPSDEQKLDAANSATSSKQVKQPPQPETEWNLMDWILFTLVSLVVITGLATAAFFIIKSVKDSRARLEANFKSISSRHEKLRNEVEGLKQTVGSFTQQISQQQQSISNLKRKLGEVDSRQGSVAPQGFQSSAPKPEFPVSAEEYLAKVRSNSVIGTVDAFTGNIVEDSTKNSEFLLFTRGNKTFALPSVDRFNTRSDFSYMYQNFYQCDRPSSGEIWIKSPAQVQRSENGWKLLERGELEVR